MKDNVIASYAEFHHEANKIFFTAYDEFLLTSVKLEKAGNENAFQLHRAQYAATVKQRMERCADNVIARSESASLKDNLRFGLPSKIEFYIREFLRKTEFR